MTTNCNWIWWSWTESIQDMWICVAWCFLFYLNNRDCWRSADCDQGWRKKIFSFAAKKLVLFRNRWRLKISLEEVTVLFVVNMEIKRTLLYRTPFVETKCNTKSIKHSYIRIDFWDHDYIKSSHERQCTASLQRSRNQPGCKCCLAQ